MQKSKIGDIHDGLRKDKDQYCSTPILKNYIEDRAWWVCKKHDNDCGKNSTVSLATAHWRFLKGILTKSAFPWLLRLPIVLLALPVIIIRGHGDYKPEK